MEPRLVELVEPIRLGWLGQLLTPVTVPGHASRAGLGDIDCRSCEVRFDQPDRSW
jgi:hypothetical protein